jgi:hypothetical protein
LGSGLESKSRLKIGIGIEIEDIYWDRDVIKDSD